VTYELDREQYVAFVINRAIWAFKLNGLLTPRPAPPAPPVEEQFRGAVRQTNQITLGTMMTGNNELTGERYEWFSEHTLDPVRAQVKVGQTVIWNNHGKSPHTATARDRSWTTGAIEPGANRSVTFDKPGTYTYICESHPWSIGQLIVEP
jgi:plastocyanin